MFVDPSEPRVMKGIYMELLRFRLIFGSVSSCPQPWILNVTVVQLAPWERCEWCIVGVERRPGVHTQHQLVADICRCSPGGTMAPHLTHTAIKSGPHSPSVSAATALGIVCLSNSSHAGLQTPRFSATLAHGKLREKVEQWKMSVIKSNACGTVGNNYLHTFLGPLE